jgi:hypothetical protein
MPRHTFAAAFHVCSHFSQVASVAILPSALFGERFFARCSMSSADAILALSRQYHLLAAVIF